MIWIRSIWRGYLPSVARNSPTLVTPTLLCCIPLTNYSNVFANLPLTEIFYEFPFVINFNANESGRQTHLLQTMTLYDIRSIPKGSNQTIGLEVY